ncbi:MAG: hypothetical protein BroJett042_04880 [Bacteroidota bacterium]|nr:MAG: hypothetical protein BroJett042_04880 [Bacteroidota bacterium]
MEGGGETKTLDTNFASDVSKIAGFNAANDIDFPRAAAQDKLNNKNDALGVIGLSPGKAIGLLSFLAGKALPTADQIAKTGFGIQTSQSGNVGVVSGPTTVVRSFDSKLIDE